jgi:hypothetical protein
MVLREIMSVKALFPDDTNYGSDKEYFLYSKLSSFNEKFSFTITF